MQGGRMIVSVQCGAFLFLVSPVKKTTKKTININLMSNLKLIISFFQSYKNINDEELSFQTSHFENSEQHYCKNMIYKNITQDKLIYYKKDSGKT